ncbi:MAG: lytic murein transglycosylase B [Burkholderiales bacterium]|nr:lytic murein transglycosylase B [Burkholderiales bacterium]
MTSLCTILCGTLALHAPDAHAAKKKKKKTHALASSLRKSASVHDNVHFSQWKEVDAFIDRMAGRHGFDKAQLTSTFDQVRYVAAAIQLVKPAPPGRPKNWQAYRARFIEPHRIEAGVAFWDKYAAELARAEQEYGVPAEIIVGLLGVETIFGQNTGSYRVMDTLTTLAFDYPDTPNRVARMEFFRSELENMLLLARDAGLDPFLFKGSYAGAIGWPQFMPDSIRQFAVDFDGDGRIDLTDSAADAIGSVAHYLATHGWKKNLPIAFPATLTCGEERHADLTAALGRGLHASYPLQDLKSLVSTASSEAPPNILYGLVNLENGEEPTEYWLATDNFYAITRYNRSYFYAMSVFDLGRVINAARMK